MSVWGKGLRSNAEPNSANQFKLGGGLRASPTVTVSSELEQPICFSFTVSNWSKTFSPGFCPATCSCARTPAFGVAPKGDLPDRTQYRPIKTHRAATVWPQEKAQADESRDQFRLRS